MVRTQNLFRKIYRYLLNYGDFFMMHDFFLQNLIDIGISSVEIASSELQGRDSSSVFFLLSDF